MNRKVLRRFSIAAIVVGALVLVDGLVLLFTNGLKTDATPILPEFGGMFSKTRSSGASLVVLGVVIVALAVIGRWWMSRRVDPGAAPETVGPGASAVGPGATRDSGTTPDQRNALGRQATQRPEVDVEAHEPATPA